MVNFPGAGSPRPAVSKSPFATLLFGTLGSSIEGYLLFRGEGATAQQQILELSWSHLKLAAPNDQHHSIHLLFVNLPLEGIILRGGQHLGFTHLETIYKRQEIVQVQRKKIVRNMQHGVKIEK